MTQTCIKLTCSLRLLALFGALAACEPAVYSARVSPINAYRSYGDYHPTAIDDAVVAKAESTEIAGKNIRIFQEALPEGVTMAGGVLGVEKGYKHKLIGKYAFSNGTAISKDALVVKVKKMCVATGANAAMVVFQMVPNDHQDQAQAIEAVLMNYVPEGNATH